LRPTSTKLQRDVFESALGVEPLLDPGLLLDLVGGHRRPAIGRVADHVFVRADVLTLDDGQRLEAGHERELLTDDDRHERLDGLSRLGGRCGPWARGTPGLHLPDEFEHLVVSRHERDDEIVIADLPDLCQSRSGQIPRILVVEDHRQTVERLELGHRLRTVEDLLVAMGRVVRPNVDRDEAPRGFPPGASPAAGSSLRGRPAAAI
jgi:hypothetical protein